MRGARLGLPSVLSSHLLLLLLLLLMLLLIALLLLLKVELLLLVGEVLGVGLVVRSLLFTWLVINVAQVLENVDKHHALLLYISLISVTNKVHVDTAVSTTSLAFTVIAMMERVLFVKVIKILIANLASDGGLVWGDLLADIVPVKAIEEWVRFYFLSTIATETHLWISDKFVEDIGRVG